MTSSLIKRNFNLDPFLHFGVGFERLFDEFDLLSTFEQSSNFPPYNVFSETNGIRTLQLALAGFSISDIDVVVEEKDGTTLTVRSKPLNEKEMSEDDGRFVHRGIAKRAFVRQFKIYGDLEVVDADMDNGLLTITLKEKTIKENVKHIPITSSKHKQLETK